ncbi:MAG: TonB-dependent receptor [Bacteroidota bacterium]|nr:TonB-dependent receptor [Bacteroidota bacterium]
MKLFFTLLLSFVITTVFAQNAETELDAVTVSASLQAQPSSRSGRNIVTIRGDQFDNLPVHSIDELLRYFPGIEVQQRGPMGSQSDIVIRGGTFQQVLVILDGVRLNDPNTGHFNSYIPIAPAEIERIEILKGASSAIYGSEAVGGVINIITKTFAANRKLSGSPDGAGRPGREKKQFSLEAGAGQYNLWNVNAGGFYQKGKTAVSGGVLTNNTDGQLQRGTRGYFNNNTASLSFNHYFNDSWQLSLRSAYDSRKFSAQNFYTTYVSDTAKEQVKTFWNQLRLAYQKAGDKLSFDLGYKAVQDNYAFNPAIAPNDNKSKLWQALIVYEHRFSGTTTLVSGGQFQDRTIRSNDRGDHAVKQAAAFAIINQAVGKNFFVSPALRLDWDERGGTELVPQVNLSCKEGKFQLRASAGKTIREADFTERFNNYNKPLVTSGSIGNPDLEAERSFSYEAGADYFLRNNWKISATFFRRDQHKVIDWVTTPYSDMPRKDNLSPAGIYALATNIANVNTTGAEADIQYNRHFNRHQAVWATLGLVWLDSKSSNSVPSFYISSHAKFLTNFNVHYSNKLFSLSVNGIYKHRDPQKSTAINTEVNADCFIVNTNADVFFWQQKMSVFVEVDNLTDKKSEDLLGSQLPGRWLMGGVRLHIGK